MNVFRILSLDGGGVRGAYSAGVLAEIQKSIEGKVIDYFDLITGTSTGGILAIGLGLGLSPTDLVNFYQTKGTEIFPVTGVWGGFLRKVRQLIVETKYDFSKLESALETILEERKLGESLRPLIITSYNASRDGAHLFKTYHHPDHNRHYKMKAVHIAMATSAAPTYFNARDLPLGDRGKEQTFVDGGIWANCPVLVGVAEAIRYFGKNLEQIEVLSIGTTYMPFKIKERQKAGAGLDWGLDLVDLMMSAQQASIIGTAKILLGESRVTRITRPTEEEIPLDDAKRIQELIDWGKEDAKEKLPFVVTKFFQDVAPAFTPITPIVA